MVAAPHQRWKQPTLSRTHPGNRPGHRNGGSSRRPGPACRGLPAGRWSACRIHRHIPRQSRNIRRPGPPRSRPVSSAVGDPPAIASHGYSRKAGVGDYPSPLQGFRHCVPCSPGIPGKGEPAPYNRPRKGVPCGGGEARTSCSESGAAHAEAETNSPVPCMCLHRDGHGRMRNHTFHQA